MYDTCSETLGSWLLSENNLAEISLQRKCFATKNISSLANELDFGSGKQFVLHLKGRSIT